MTAAARVSDVPPHSDAAPQAPPARPSRRGE